MNIEIEDIDDRKRQAEHLSFFCTTDMKDRLMTASAELSNSLSATIRKLITVGLRFTKKEDSSCF